MSRAPLPKPTSSQRPPGAAIRSQTRSTMAAEMTRCVSMFSPGVCCDVTRANITCRLTPAARQGIDDRKTNKRCPIEPAFSLKEEGVEAGERVAVDGDAAGRERVAVGGEGGIPSGKAHACRRRGEEIRAAAEDV